MLKFGQIVTSRDIVRIQNLRLQQRREEIEQLMQKLPARTSGEVRDNLRHQLAVFYKNPADYDQVPALGDVMVNPQPFPDIGW